MTTEKLVRFGAFDLARSKELRETYEAITREPIPEEMQKLLDRLR